MVITVIEIDMPKGFMDYKTYDTSNGYGSAYEWRRTFKKRMKPDEAKDILQEDDPYIILGLNITANRAEIKRAYYDMAMKWHPDRNPGNIELATEMMKKINAAYCLLS